MQYTLAGRIGERVSQSFGVKARNLDDAVSYALSEVAEQETKGSDTVSNIIDDMEAYFDRHRLQTIKTVLEDMRKQDVVGNLRQISGDLKTEKGLSMAQCEYWSDTLDRWAEDFVEGGCSGTCSSCKSKGSLPPALVLEVLQILEGEVNLREETRVAEQARPSLTAEKHKHEADKLAKTQRDLQGRLLKVISEIGKLPDAQADFGKDLRLLGMVTVVMDEAAGILSRPDTGRAAIGAETEVIELLLQSKRINPKGGGGGGGANPGGGGGGSTQNSALTLLGSGVNPKEFRQDRGVSQATGETGSVLPEVPGRVGRVFQPAGTRRGEKPKSP